MSVIVVGGDHLGSIEKKLYELGAKELIHVSGRKKLDRKKLPISQRTSFVLVLTDYVNHDIAARVKERAKTLHVPLIFAKRSWSSVEQKIKAGGFVKAELC
ncbi:DUF2325 domain-containing protein [Sporolituus thermophilus]|nr:DUF2325 domain-containing protein [Sporolituus thermophilus]